MMSRNAGNAVSATAKRIDLVKKSSETDVNDLYLG